MELISGQRGATTTVLAETALVCLAFPFKLARQEYTHNLDFLLQIAKDLAAKLNRSTENLLQASLAPGLNRVCRFLFQEQQDGVYRGTLSSAAHVSGLSYRQVERIMIKLCQEKMVSKQEDGYHISDLSKLKEQAGL